MLYVLFWLSIAGLFYIYIGYPLIAVLLARLCPRPVRRGPFRASVSILISVYGEAHRLVDKLRSLLASEGADQIREILVGSDGSSDDVSSAVARVGDPRIRAVLFSERRGKPSVLNDLMGMCAGEIVVLTDARQHVSKGALRALLENFADPVVGVVSGELVFVEPDGGSTASKGINAYWKYEKMIRKAEGLFGSVPGATGALYAIRRELLMPLPANTLLDDVAIPLQAICRGYRCVFEPMAQVYDVPQRDARAEAIRKRRTLAGNVQLIQLWPALLNPRKNPAWFAFLSHKIARLISPLLLLLALGLNVYLAWSDAELYNGLLVLQAVFWVMAGLGWLGSRLGLRMSLPSVPFMFIALNLSILAALYDALCGRYRVCWARGGDPIRSESMDRTS